MVVSGSDSDGGAVLVISGSDPEGPFTMSAQERFTEVEVEVVATAIVLAGSFLRRSTFATGARVLPRYETRS